MFRHHGKNTVILLSDYTKLKEMENKDLRKINIDHSLYTTRLSKKFQSRKPYAPPVHGNVCSFIPGTVVEVLIKTGDSVAEGDDLVILDAMKMKNRLKSHVSGTVSSVNVSKGDRVTKGAVLVVIKAEE